MWSATGVLVGRDAELRALEFWRWPAEAAPSERAFFEAFFTWVYTPRRRLSTSPCTAPQFRTIQTG